MKKNKPTNDWSVSATGKGHPLTYQLKYKSAIVDTQKGVDGQRTLEAQAEFANSKGLVPDKSSCNCDPGPRKTVAQKLREQPELFTP